MIKTSGFFGQKLLVQIGDENPKAVSVFFSGTVTAPKNSEW